jgi:hypothetical protein
MGSTHICGGAITAVPYSSPVRIELPVEKAALGEKLAELGYMVSVSSTA